MMYIVLSSGYFGADFFKIYLPIWYNIDNTVRWKFCGIICYEMDRAHTTTK